MRLSFRPCAAWLAAFAIATAACAPPPARVATPEHPNVLFIAIDTLRSDRPGCYGNSRGLTPHIDALAREGARFERCFAHAPWTLPAFASILTSLYPEQHGAGGGLQFHGAQGAATDFRGLARGVPTMPESFRDAGYATMAVVNVDFLSPPFGLTRGFEHCDVRFSENNEDMRDARATTDAALGWLAKHEDKAFFLFVHYFDPHAEYRPPQPFRRKFAAAPDRESDGFVFGTREQVAKLRLHLLPLVADDVQRAAQLYDGEVAYVDDEIGRLLAQIAKSGLDERTLVVLTADHGEEFLDHGGWEHGHTLYDELLHVPLIVRQKGRIAPRVAPDLVAHVDVAPTVCSLCAVAAPSAAAGHDLSPLLLRGEPAPRSTALAFGNFWGAPLRALRDDEYKLIVKPAEREHGEARELYRWRDDPRETRDLAASMPDVVARLSAELARAEQDLAAHGFGDGPRVALTAAQVQRLKGLGYTGGDGDR
jgi:arylsulfatase A-like enzyme